MGYRFPVTEAMEDRWYDQILADQSGRRASFAIEDSVDGVLVGFVHLTEIDWPSRTAQFGIVIGDRSRQCRGIGSEATALALRYAFDTLNLDRLELRVSEINARARHIYLKLGFHEEGRLRKAAYIDGAVIDVVIMGILREEFRRGS